MEYARMSFNGPFRSSLHRRRLAKRGLLVRGKRMHRQQLANKKEYLQRCLDAKQLAGEGKPRAQRHNSTAQRK